MDTLELSVCPPYRLKVLRYSFPIDVILRLRFTYQLAAFATCFDYPLWCRVRVEATSKEGEIDKVSAELHRVRSQLGFAQDRAKAIEVGYKATR